MSINDFAVTLLVAMIAIVSAHDGLTYQQVLDWHNNVRAKVATGKVPGQPPAGDMIALEWDDRLAEQSKKWAQTCSQQMHDTNKDRWFAPYASIGQDFSGFGWGQKLIMNHLNPWADEYKDFDYSSVGCKSGGNDCVFGHYTQVAWAESTLIGCFFEPDACKDGSASDRMICEFATGGNVANEKGKLLPPYTRGSPCSSCPVGFTFCMADSLCASKTACSGSDSKCECSLNEKDCNGGTFDSAACSCTCPAGKSGAKCDQTCEDTITFCDGYKEHCSPASSQYSDYFTWLSGSCAKTCDRCGTVAGVRSDPDHATNSAFVTRVGGETQWPVEGELAGVTPDSEVSTDEEKVAENIDNEVTEPNTDTDTESTPNTDDKGGSVVEATNECIDAAKPEECAFWKEQGYCETNADNPHLQKDCPKTCGWCTGEDEKKVTETDSDCIDNNDNCGDWAGAGYCDQESVQAACPKTCDTCGGKAFVNKNAPAEGVCADRYDGCPAWAADGQCETNESVLLACPLSCDACK